MSIQSIELELDENFTAGVLEAALWALAPEYHTVHGVVPENWMARFSGTRNEATSVELSLRHPGDSVPQLGTAYATHSFTQFEHFCRSVRKTLIG